MELTTLLRIIPGNPFHSCLRMIIIARRTPTRISGKHDALLPNTLIISSHGEWAKIYLDPFLSLALIAKAAPVRASPRRPRHRSRDRKKTYSPYK